MRSESTLIGCGEEEFEFEAFRLALSRTLMTPSEVRAAGSSPLLVLMFLSAPWLHSRFTMFRWFLLAAQCRAVHPLMSC